MMKSLVKFLVDFARRQNDFKVPLLIANCLQERISSLPIEAKQCRLKSVDFCPVKTCLKVGRFAVL